MSDLLGIFDSLKDAGIISDITWSKDIPNKFKENGEKLSNCWKTPSYLFNLLKEEFPFTLDAAADEDNHLCHAYYTYECSGLDKNWVEDHDFIFVNPPYDDSGTWVKKASEQAALGACVVMVLNETPGTKYWHDYIWEPEYDSNGQRLPWATRTRDNVRVRHMRGRIAFDPPEGVKASSPRHENCVVIFYPYKQTIIDSVTYPWDDHD